ncbi:MAG TPA: YqaA family protein [Aestuariivirgaceae bacterium]|nr:YqaA family protein [Aestuariivirgaceae bacterium]
MLRRLYDWVMNLAGHRHAEPALAGVAFVESSVFPIPPDVMLMPMAYARPNRAFRYALVATVASVLGGLAGYAIGFFLFETVGRAILELYGFTEKFDDFALRYNEHGAAIVFFAGLTPFPFKVITIASGVTGLNLLSFIVASIAARGMRFFLVCGLIYWFGPPVRGFIERHLGLMTLLFGVLLVGGFVVAGYLL